MGYSPWGYKELDMTVTFTFTIHSLIGIFSFNFSKPYFSVYFYNFDIVLMHFSKILLSTISKTLSLTPLQEIKVKRVISGTLITPLFTNNLKKKSILPQCFVNVSHIGLSIFR